MKNNTFSFVRSNDGAQTMDEFWQRCRSHLYGDGVVLQRVRQGRDEEHRVHLQELTQDLAGHDSNTGCAHSLYYASRLQCHGYI